VRGLGVRFPFTYSTFLNLSSAIPPWKAFEEKEPKRTTKRNTRIPTASYRTPKQSLADRTKKYRVKYKENAGKGIAQNWRVENKQAEKPCVYSIKNLESGQ